MTTDRWKQAKSIFDGAVECDPAARAQYVRERCGNDEELLNEVESLRASDQEASSLLEHPVIEAAAIAAAPVLNVPPPDATSEATLILKDRYEVVRELGCALLEETQRDPWIRQKFQQKMEALARIDHPGVVGVLDTGLTAEGKQLLVMQYVEGSTLR
jgi:eukaryotic-like serine/threonine-protein kinase